MDHGIVVVGFGAAGLAVCEELRARGWSGRLTVLARERSLPYDRPPLSKAYLRGAVDHDALSLLDDRGLAALDADVQRGRTAVHLDVLARAVVDDAGVTHRYDEVVIASGARPRTIDGPHGPLPTLRGITDAQRLRDGFGTGGTFLVIGGGFLGLEVAATARQLGQEVTVVEPMERLLGDRLGIELSARLHSLHTGNGVDVRTGCTVVGMSAGADGGAVSAMLSDGTTVVADRVLAAVGASPDTSWLAGADLHLSDGIVCDRWCRAAPGVWAAGDVARWYHAGLGRHLRLEHRVNATEQGRAVAGNILGDARPFAPLPYVWTDQFGVRIQFAGTTDDASPVVVDHDGAGGPTVVEWHRGGTVTGLVSWDSPGPFFQRRRQLAAAAHADRPGMALEVLCPACGGLVEAVGEEALVRAAWQHTRAVHDYVIPPEHVLQRAEAVS